MFRLRPSLLPVKSAFLLPGLPRILCLYNRPEYTSVGGGPVFFIWARDSLPVLGWLLISRGMITIGRDTEGRQREVQTTGAASRRPLPSSRPRDSFSTRHDARAFTSARRHRDPRPTPGREAGHWQRPANRYIAAHQAGEDRRGPHHRRHHQLYPTAGGPGGPAWRWPRTVRRTPARLEPACRRPTRMRRAGRQRHFRNARRCPPAVGGHEAGRVPPDVRHATHDWPPQP